VKSNILAATIIALGLMMAGILNGGIYYMERDSKETAVYRINRLTGRVSVCAVEGGCHVIGEGRPLRGEPKVEK
jgi:hypothetical protein